MGEDRLARRPAVVVLVLALTALIVLGAVLVPWDWLPGGSFTPAEASDVFTPPEVARAETYAGTVRPLAWAGLGATLLVTVALGFTRVGGCVVGALPRLLRVPLGTLVVLLCGQLAALPFDLLIRAERVEVGLTRQPLVDWFRDRAVALGLAWLLTAAALAAMVWLARRSPRWWFAWAAAASAGATLVLSFVYPVLVEPLFNSFTPMPQNQLARSIEDLAAKEGVPIDEVLVSDASRRTTTLNAYVSGFGSTRRVVVYDNLLAELEPDEIRSVVAHELGHAKHHDVLLGTALGGVATVAGTVLLALLLDRPRLRRAAGVQGPSDARVVPLVLALAALGALLAGPAQSTASRAIEARADRDAMTATNDLPAFVGLQHRLAVTSLADPTPPRWAQVWFGSHPTVLERIGLATAVARAS